MDISKVEDINTAAFFIEVGKPLAKAKTIKETLDILMYQVGCIFQPMNWSLLLKDPKTGDMVFTVVVGSSREKLKGVRIPKGEGIAGHILSTGESVIVHNVDEDNRFSMRMDDATGFKTQSIIGVPLKTDEKIFGVIELINKINGDNFTEVEMHLLSSIAEYAAIAIERSYYNQALKKIALIDSLTGLKNRMSFDRVLSNKIELYKKHKVFSSMLVININNFKGVIDKYGHDLAERLLKEFAKVLASSLRSVDEAFRYEGDKFVVIMPQTSLDKAEKTKQIFLQQLKSAVFLDGSLKVQATVAIRFVDSGIQKEIFSVVKNIKTQVSPDPQWVENKSDNDLPDVAPFLKKSEISEGEGTGNMHDMENNLKPMLDEEDVEIQQNIMNSKVAYIYKDVILSGDYRHFNKNAHGYITVVKISIQAVCFETMRQNNLKPGDILDITFNLDDSRNSLIKRRVRVDKADEKFVEAQYHNPPPFDKNLGFYLMA